MIAIYEIQDKNIIIPGLNKKAGEYIMDNLIMPSGKYKKIEGDGALIGMDIGSIEDDENQLEIALSYTDGNSVLIQFLGGLEKDVSESKKRLNNILKPKGYIIK
jgi:hypothetical protein